MKNKLFVILLCSILIVLSLFKLELVKQYNRSVETVVIPDSIKLELISSTVNMSDVEIINTCVVKTANLLKFSKTQDTIFKYSVSRAHCVNYSKVCSALCNIAFENNNIKAKAFPVVGYVSLFGINLNELIFSISNDYFFKDHDFVEIKGKNYIIYVDPCLYDLINTDLKVIKTPDDSYL